MPNVWIQHVRDFAKKYNLKYREALKDPRCKSSYHGKKTVRGGNAEDTDFHGGVVPDYDFYNYYSGRVERKGGDLGGQYIASDGTLVYDLGNGTKLTQVYDPRTQKYKYIYL